MGLEKVEDLDLGQLVEEVSSDMVQERTRQAAGLIKKQLQRMEQLSKDIVAAKKELKSKQDKLVKAQDTIDKIRSGDWKVLAQLDNQNSQISIDLEIKIGYSVFFLA